MKKITEVILKIITIFFLIKFINQFLPSVFLTSLKIINSADSIQITQLIYYLSYSIFNLVTLILLWKFADKISNYIISNDSHLNINIDLNKADILQIAFFITGIILLAINLPQLGGQLLQVMFFSGPFRFQNLTKITVPLLKIGIAIWLVLRNKKLIYIFPS